ncbi:MAG: VCBS repeat-containing protein [Acidobacteria bacterium]|nr:VCBS repeat-containing protein [Acidobacteriota bacterium]
MKAKQPVTAALFTEIRSDLGRSLFGNAIRLILSIIVVGAFSVLALGQSAVDGFHADVNGLVYRVEASFNGIYLAGQQFTTVNGVAKSHLARLNYDGSLDTTYNPNPNSALQALAVSGNKLVVIGSFTQIGGGPSAGIARLNFNGTNDGAFTAAISGAAAVAVQSDGKVLVGGHFTTIGGTPRSKLARFNADGTLDATFTPNVDDAVFGISLQPDGKILICGQFFNVNGQTRWRFARLNADGSLDNSFIVNAGFPGSNGSTYSSAVQADGKIVIAGSFSRFGEGSTARNNFARLNADGTPDPSFTPNFSGPVYSLHIQADDTILAGGQFVTLNGAARNNIARLNRNGTVDSSFVGSADNYVTDVLTFADGRVITCGAFTAINGFPSINRIARLYPDGRLDGDTNLSIVGGPPVEIVALPGGQTLIAGGFTSVGGAARQGMARLGWTGANDSTFANPQLTGWAYALAVQPDGKYLVGGDFASAGGTGQSRIARFNSNGVIDGTFAPTFTYGASTPFVNSISIQLDGKILVAGQFTAVNGITSNRIVRLTQLGQVDITFAANVDYLIDVIAVQQDGKILIGGAFENVGGQPRTGLARLNANGTLDTTFNPVLNGIVHEVSDIKIDRAGKILVGGSFAGVNGNGRANLVRLNSDGTLDPTFTAAVIDGTVLSIQFDTNDNIFIAGRFGNVDGLPRAYIAMLNTSGSVNSLFQNTAANENIQSMNIRDDGKILVGGYFTLIGGQSRNQFAALSRSNGPPIYFLTANSSTIQWYRDGIAPEVNRVIFERSTDGVNYTFLGNGISSPAPYYTWNLAMPPGTPSGYIRARGYANDFSDRRSLYEMEVYYAVPQTRRSPFDFDGDGKTDISIFRPSLGQWWLNRSNLGTIVHTFGNSADKLTPGDFTGDGVADVAIFRPSTGEWFVLRSENATFYSFPFGSSTDIPVPADYDGDSRADAAVFRPSNSTWYIQKSAGGTTIETFGVGGDVPVPADYDGDGQTDIAIYRPSLGQWWLKRSTAGIIAQTFGVSTDKTVQGDYTGDGKADVAVFRPTTGEWLILRSENSTFYSFPFGANGDAPAPGDYDGDGRFDAAVFRSSSATWYIQQSTAGTLIQSFGSATDVPIPNAYVR